jgi:hypothetical protein
MIIIIFCVGAFMDTKFVTEGKGVKYFPFEIHTLWQDTHSASKWISPESVAVALIENGAGEAENTWALALSFAALGTVTDASDRPCVRGSMSKELEQQI